jgi:hypothetical protein
LLIKRYHTGKHSELKGKGTQGRAKALVRMKRNIFVSGLGAFLKKVY